MSFAPSGDYVAGHPDISGDSLSSEHQGVFWPEGMPDPDILCLPEKSAHLIFEIDHDILGKPSLYAFELPGLLSLLVEHMTPFL
jgi:hypothetical protein